MLVFCIPCASVCRCEMFKVLAHFQKVCYFNSSLCELIQGKEDKALWVLSQSIVELGLGSRPKLHAVVLLNMSSLLSKMGRHEEAFESSETALKMIQGQLGGKKHDWYVCILKLHTRAHTHTHTHMYTHTYTHVYSIHAQICMHSHVYTYTRASRFILYILLFKRVVHCAT
jgi:hypothetical protein